MEDAPFFTEQQDIEYHRDFLEETFGTEWWYELPETTNPDYAYLCRIIKAVQAGLKQLKLDSSEN